MTNPTQTATVSDEAVQAFKQEFHENSPKRGYDENIKSALTAAAPYLTASVEVGELKRQLINANTSARVHRDRNRKLRIRKRVLLTALREVISAKNHGDAIHIANLAVGGWENEEFLHKSRCVVTKPVDVAAVREQALAALRDINIREEVDGYEWRGDGDYMPNDQEKALLEDFGNGLIDRVEEAIRALSPAEPAQADQWQPIATAPKDGTAVLCGWFDTDTNRVYAIAGWYETAPQDRCWYDQYDERIIPTHWMPLPAAPLSAGRTTGGGEA